MTDNRTTEQTATERLRSLLDERGVEYETADGWWTSWDTAGALDIGAVVYCEDLGSGLEIRWHTITPEQAIAATLGSEPPYDELLRCLENDWNISASWDGLRKFWCIELTEEGVKLRDATHGTLTAEQVREAVMSADHWEKPMGSTGLTNTHLIIRDDGWQAIADELNARAERTCRNNKDKWSGLAKYLFVCSECGWNLIDVGNDAIDISAKLMKRCPMCGAKVVGK